MHAGHSRIVQVVDRPLNQGSMQCSSNPVELQHYADSSSASQEELLQLFLQSFGLEFCGKSPGTIVYHETNVAVDLEMVAVGLDSCI